MCSGQTAPPASIPQRIALLVLRAYRAVLSPLLGPRCRFHPSCSQYAAEAITRFGVLRGSVLALFRLLRCQPLCAGGVDPVPIRFPRKPWRRTPVSAPTP